MIEALLRNYAERTAEEPGDPAALLAALVDEMRPPRPEQVEPATLAVIELCHILDSDPAMAQALRDAILRLLGERKPVSLLVDSGIQPSNGFFSEMWRRFNHKLLPDAIDPAYLKDLFALIFSRSSDVQWVLGVDDEVWLQLLQALRFDTAEEPLLATCRRNLLDAVHVLSYRISAMGLESELIRSHPELEDHASPFIVQNIELGAFLTDLKKDDDADAEKEEADAKHILVMLDQCRQVIAKIRRNISQTGTSIRLTFILQRMTQQIRRLEILLGMISSLRAGDNADLAFVRLFKDLVYGECHKNDARQHWHGNMELLALRVTDNASRTGEHYITATRSQYFELMRSAMGAGFIITLMATIKVLLAGQHMAPLTEAILFSLNYGLGFVIIHILHFTVATKQPAMTANSIALSIDGSDNKTREMDSLVTIIAQMMRSQLVAILGNVIIVLPFAMLVAGLLFGLNEHHFISPQKAVQMLKDVNPLQSGSVIYAGIAGICLFLSGLIAGYHDNMATYNKIPQRLRALGWLQKLLGRERLDRMAVYIENNLGALAGNFYFGCLLGGMSGLGVLLGLPVDIRHITFSSAFVGFSLVGLDFAISPAVLWMTALGLALIGFMNLTVSFCLALYVAMKSRKVSFRQWRLLATALLRRIYERPREFLFPPDKRMLETEAEH